MGSGGRKALAERHRGRANDVQYLLGRGWTRAEEPNKVSGGIWVDHVKGPSKCSQLSLGNAVARERARDSRDLDVARSRIADLECDADGLRDTVRRYQEIERLRKTDGTCGPCAGTQMICVSCEEPSLSGACEDGGHPQFYPCPACDRDGYWKFVQERVEESEDLPKLRERAGRADAAEREAALALERISEELEPLKEGVLGLEAVLGRLRGCLAAYKGGIVAHARGEAQPAGPAIADAEEDVAAWAREGWSVAAILEELRQAEATLADEESAHAEETARAGRLLKERDEARTHAASNQSHIEVVRALRDDLAAAVADAVRKIRRKIRGGPEDLRAAIAIDMLGRLERLAGDALAPAPVGGKTISHAETCDLNHPFAFAKKSQRRCSCGAVPPEVPS